jgi:hypothetical protein
MVLNLNNNQILNIKKKIKNKEIIDEMNNIKRIFKKMYKKIKKILIKNREKSINKTRKLTKIKNNDIKN